jgi:hypothetical protein
MSRGEEIYAPWNRVTERVQRPAVPGLACPCINWPHNSGKTDGWPVTEKAVTMQPGRGLSLQSLSSAFFSIGQLTFSHPVPAVEARRHLQSAEARKQPRVAERGPWALLPRATMAPDGCGGLLAPMPWTYAVSTGGLHYHDMEYICSKQKCQEGGRS